MVGLSGRVISPNYNTIVLFVAACFIIVDASYITYVFAIRAKLQKHLSVKNDGSS